MRVAFDVTVAARSMSGVGSYARELLPRLRARGLDVVRWQHPLGPPSVGGAGLASALRLALWLELQVSRRIRAERVDVYHAATSIAPLSTPRPRVMTVHDAILLTMRSQYGFTRRLYHRVFSVLAARRARAILVPSATARAEITRVYRVPPERLWIAPLGVSARFRRVDAPEVEAVTARLGVQPPYVLFVGAAPPRKNLVRLLEAFARVRRPPTRPLQLVLVGPPEPRDRDLEDVASRLGVADDFRSLGWVSDTELAALYSGALCLAYPSLVEGFGLPILEAMACGTPVLTSRDPSIAETAGDAALLVDPLSVDAIADGLVRLLDDRAFAAELVSRGHERVRAFTWERTAEITDAVYRRIAAGSAP